MTEEFARIESIVTEPKGFEWLKLLHQLKLGSPQEIDGSIAEELIALGICQRIDRRLVLTPFGNKCADSAREYVHWVDRQRRLHFEDQHAATELELFRAKDVLELGPGWGCTLVRVATVARSAVGIEIEPVYVRFSRIFARREALARPPIAVGVSDNIPFRAKAFDWIIIWQALYYMDIDTTFKECNRVLRPGGHVLINLPLMHQFVQSELGDIARHASVRKLISLILIVLNSVWYELFGLRLRQNIKGDPGRRPIYLSRRALISAAERSGLRFCNELSGETVNNMALVVFRKDS
jgi:SAM-dependent methyltransferase